MGEKVKFIIIGSAGILVISIFINLQTYSAKKAMEVERNSLKSENKTLTQKIEEFLKERKQLQEKISALNSDLDKISQEKETLQKQKEEIQEKYGAVVKEKDTLIEKLKTSPIAGGVRKEAVSTKEEAYWAEILQAKTNLSLQVENLRSELETLQMDNEQLRKDLANLTRAKQDLEQQLIYNQKSLDSITSQLVIEKGEKFRLQDELGPIKNENAILRQQLKSLSTKEVKLKNQLRQLQEEKSNLERRLNDIELFLEDKFSRKKDLELKNQLDTVRRSAEEAIPSQKQSVELPPIVVRPQTQPVAVTPSQTEGPIAQEEGAQIYVRGSVLGVNKENNFVVIDLGQNTGIKMGDTFRVYREGEVIAILEVIQVRGNISACDIKEEIAPIEVGDTIR